jgi:hypothetical protein
LSVTCGRSVVLSEYSCFLHQYNWPPRYSWTIIESEVKHYSRRPVVAMNNKICLNYHRHLIECNFFSHYFIAEKLHIWRVRLIQNKHHTHPFLTRYWRSVGDTTLRDKACQWLTPGRMLTPSTPACPINKTDPHDIAEIVLKGALNTIPALHMLLWTIKYV